MFTAAEDQDNARKEKYTSKEQFNQPEPVIVERSWHNLVIELHPFGKFFEEVDRVPGEAKADVFQVWSLTQFYSVGISQSRIIAKRCVFH